MSPAVGFFHLADDDQSEPLAAAGCLDVAGVTAARRSPAGLFRLYEYKHRPDPASFGASLRAWAQQLPPGWIHQVGNEANLVFEGFGGGPRDYADWAVAVGDVVDGAAAIGVGAFSPGPAVGGVRAYADVDGWAALRPQLEADPGLVAIAHVYGRTLAELIACYRRCADNVPSHTRIAVGELNFGPATGFQLDRDRWAAEALGPFLDWLAANDPRAVMALYFARRRPGGEDNPELAGGTPVDGAGTAIERTLRDWRPPQHHEEPTPVLRGIDISNNNGHVDLGKAWAAGYRFVVLKVTEDELGDDDFFDSYATENLASARELGFGVGIYTFIRPSRSSPAESIGLLERAIARLGGLREGEWIVLDCEDEQFTGDLHVWLAEALALGAQVFGFRLWKYSADWYTSTRDLEHPDLAPFPTWWASYQDNLPEPQVGWGPIRMWQHGVLPAGSVPGVVGPCDVDVFFGTLEELRATGKPAAAAPPAPAPVSDPVGDALAGLQRELDALRSALGRAA